MTRRCTLYRSSLAACAVFAALWLGACLFGCILLIVGPRSHLEADLRQGSLRVQHHPNSGDLPITSWSTHFRAFRYARDPYTPWHWLPRITTDTDLSAYQAHEPPGTLIVPLWLPLALAASLAAAARARDRRRARLNLCPHCSYPLSGLRPDSPCPECGKPRMHADQHGSVPSDPRSSV